MRRWLGWFAFALIVGMQAGTVFKPLGTVGDTRVADWVDLLTPYAILGCAAMVLLAAGASRPAWIAFGVGAVTFTLGHGLHLAANSIANEAPSDVAHLWDEVVSHWIWYLGLFVVMASMAVALRPREFHVGAVDLLVGFLVAVTLFNNFVEGGTPWLGVVLMLVAVVAGVRWRPAPVSRLILPIAGTVLSLLVAWGVYWFVSDGLVFPQFSELGWI